MIWGTFQILNAQVPLRLIKSELLVLFFVFLNSPGDSHVWSKLRFTAMYTIITLSFSLLLLDFKF